MDKILSKGFSLVELLIVIIILAVLTLVAIPMYQNYVARAEVATGLTEISALKVQVESCLLDGKDVAIKADGKNTGCKDLAVVGSKVVIVDGNGTSADGKAQINAKYLNNKINNKTLSLKRTQDGIWDCVSNDIDETFLPRGCSKI